VEIRGDKLAGRETVIFAERDRKLEAARELRRQRREFARQHLTYSSEL
jgi:putative transposase